MIWYDILKKYIPVYILGRATFADASKQTTAACNVRYHSIWYHFFFVATCMIPSFFFKILGRGTFDDATKQRLILALTLTLRLFVILSCCLCVIRYILSYSDTPVTLFGLFTSRYILVYISRYYLLVYCVDTLHCVHLPSDLVP